MRTIQPARRTSLVAVAALLVLISAVGCQRSEPVAPATQAPTPTNITKPSVTVRIGTLSDGIDYAPYHAAKEKKWFEEALKEVGATVEHVGQFDSPPTVKDAVDKKSVDIIFEAEIPATVARSGGADVRIIEMLSAVKADEIVVPKDSTIQRIADLKGRKVAVMSGSGYHYALLQSLAKNGLSRKNVEIVPMTPPDAKAAFEAKPPLIDAWAIWPHWPEEQVFEGRGRLVPGLNARVQVVTVARAAFVQEHPEVAAKVLEVLERAKHWVADNPAEAQRITTAALGLKPGVVALAWPKEIWITSLTPDIITDIQNKADFLASEKLITGPVDVRRSLIGSVPKKLPAAARLVPSDSTPVVAEAPPARRRAA